MSQAPYNLDNTHNDDTLEEKSVMQKSVDLLYIDRFDERDIQTAQLIYAVNERAAVRLGDNKKLEKLDKLVQYLGRNAFQALYKPTVAIRPKDELFEPLHSLRDAFEGAQNASEWKALREATVGNLPAASFAAAEFAALLVDLLPEAQTESLKDSLTQPQEDSSDQQSNTQEDSCDQQSSPQSDQSNQPSPRQDQQSSTQSNQLSAAALTALLRQAAQQAAENTRQAFEMLRAAGCEPGPDQPLHTDSLQLAQHALANEELKKLLKLLGRVRQASRKTVPAVATARRPPHLARRLTRGSDLTRIASHERICHQRHPLLFQYKAATEQLDIHDYAEAVKNNQNSVDGPIIVMVDESASMCGEPIRWARALAAAIALDGRRRNRPVAYVGWANKDQQRVVTFDQKGPKLLRDLNNLLQSFFQGGTELAPALARAAELLNKKTFRQADIVLITDGDIHDLNEAIKVLETLLKQTRLHLIQIACNIAPLARFASSAVLLRRDQLDSTAAANIIKNCFLPIKERRKNSTF